MSTLTRRDFLKLTGVGVGTLALSELGFDLAHAYSVRQTLRIGGATQAHSICPYCAVGCALVTYTRKEADGAVKLLQIEGDPDSPITEGRLCPKGATAMQLATSTRRAEHPMYRAPGTSAWQTVSWDFVLDKIAQNLKAARDRTFVMTDAAGNVVNRTEGIAFAGGATFSNEEGYFATKVMRGLGAVYLEQQARV